MYKFTREDLTTVYDNVPFQYEMGKWVQAPGQGRPDGRDCGPNRLHLMQRINPEYAPTRYVCHEAIGMGLMGESDEKASYKSVKLLRTLTDDELDAGIDRDVWATTLHKPGLWLPIAWTRKATFLDRPVDAEWVVEQLKPLHSLLNKQWVGVVYEWDNLRASLGAGLRASLRASLWDSLWDSLGANLRASLGDSLGDSLRDSLEDSLGAGLEDSLGASLWDSLGASLWASLRDSLFLERGCTYLAQPKPELTALLEVWKAGVCPLGWNHAGQIVVINR